MKVSVIICAFNPRRDYLERTLQALRNQTLPQNEWELLLVDNASEIPLAQVYDLSWHSQARHVREEKLGKPNAILRAIQEARGSLLMTVDDDNVLELDYLQKALDLWAKYPHLGVWGGSCLPEYETPPPAFLEKYLNRLAITTVSRPRWGNSYEDFETIPAGAGMVFRHDVAVRYAEAARNCKYRRLLGPNGKLLTRGDDTDIAWTAIEMGFSVGRFPDLKLTHLIPKRRLEPDYILELIMGDAASRVLLDYAHNQKTFHASKRGFLRELWLRLRLPPFDYQAWKATNAGVEKGFLLANQA